MIHFNELRITPDSKCLIIEAEVDSDELYDKVFIDNIVIDTQDTFIPNGPSSKPIYVNNVGYNFPHKKVRLKISAKELGVDLSKSMLFVYVVAGGTPSILTPCGWDNSTILGTVVNLLPIYRRSMDYIKELNKSCSIPKNFIDSILRFKSLDLSIKTGNYLEAIKIWKKFFMNITSNLINNNCNCNE